MYLPGAHVHRISQQNIDGNEGKRSASQAHKIDARVGPGCFKIIFLSLFSLESWIKSPRCAFPSINSRSTVKITKEWQFLRRFKLNAAHIDWVLILTAAVQILRSRSNIYLHSFSLTVSSVI